MGRFTGFKWWVYVWPLVIIAVIVVSTYLQLKAYDNDWRCLVTECRIVKR